jgi:hypothetical protein
MYENALVVHSLLRAVAVVLLALAFVRALHGSVTGRYFNATDRTLALLATIALDVQLLVGLALHLVWSPVTKQAFSDFGSAMKDPTLRKWVVEHPTMMLVAIVLAHVGSALRRRAETDLLRHRWTAATLGCALILVLLAMPWTSGEGARPLLRWWGTP